MRHIIFKESDRYEVALLMKEMAFNTADIRQCYVDPLIAQGVPEDTIIAFTLSHDAKGKANATHMKAYLQELLSGLQGLGTKYLYVADSAYFKVLTSTAKSEPHLGYALPCKIKGYEHLQVVLGINYQQLIYNPSVQTKLDLSVQTLACLMDGTYKAIGSDIIHTARYPKLEQDIEQQLQKLHQYPRLACDIEGFSLRFCYAHIGTIAFAWDEHNGIAIPCDYMPITNEEQTHEHGSYRRNHAVRAMLRKFFTEYQGELVFHNASYDIKAIIYALWMQELRDTKNLLAGLEVMTRNFHDTKIIAYLATNSTAESPLGLKALAHEFAGNWAVEVNNIRKVPLDNLMRYNLVDTLSTNYVFNKYWPIMVQDKQETIYREMMLPTQKLLIQMELTGMPVDRVRVDQVRNELKSMQEQYIQTLQNSPVIKTFNLLLQQSEMEKANAKLKKKQHPLEKFADETFNPNSGPQMQRLIYELMAFQVIDTTDTGLPATGTKTLQKLLHHTTSQAYKDILESLIGFNRVTKLLGTFIKALDDASLAEDNTRWLHGNFNIGGTVSGRLSSSDPNLQNLPAGNSDDKLKAKLGKLIKSCFVAPKNWLFCGADFNSLEDYISALTTKDPNKLAVYEQGFDGHSLRAAYYFRDQLPHIDLADPKSVNTIKDTHPELRQKSKGPTFALTYQGTWHTLVHTLGFPEEQAKAIEAGYHDLYKVSDQYVQDRLKQATKDGYVEVAFGLRIRTPLLHQVVYGAKGMPFEAAAEGRTAGNALGQSYGLLNNRAAVEFFQKVWASKHRYDILPVALIHDAIYILCKDDAEVVEWANRELIKSMQWQQLPEIQHPTVKLGAALDIYWPSWAHSTTLPNNADQATIRSICDATKQTLRQAA